MAVSMAVASDMGSFDEGVEAFKGKAPYARGGGNPITTALENACVQYLGNADVRGANVPYTIITASGQASNHLVYKALRGGDLVSSSHLFGTTKVDLKQTFEEEGGHIAWVDPTDTQAFIDNTTEKTTAWFVEAISNPAGRVADLAPLHKAARERNIVLVLDATLAVGMPKFDGLKYADVLTVSLTKQAGGGLNENMGGVLIVSNDFAWADHADRFPKLSRYFTDQSGKLVLPQHPFGVMMTKIGMHEGSAAIAPHTAENITKLLPEMRDRVTAQCENAQMLADVLMNHDAVKSVDLAGYNTDPENDKRTKEYLGDNHFVILTELKGGPKAAKAFINAGQFLHAVALGQRKTAVSHPASSTHRQYTTEQRAAMGIYDGTIRISVGTEVSGTLRRRMQTALRL